MTRPRSGALRAILFGTLFGVLSALACGEEPPPAPPEPEGPPPLVHVPAASAPRDIAIVEVTGFGEIQIELLPEVAPESVAWFTEKAESGYYEGTTFHRVIPGFTIQGGDPNSRDRDPRNDGKGGSRPPGPDEYSDISHVRGIVGLANSGRPGSAGSQFYIILGEHRSLDGGYTVFGHVTSGLEVADQIAGVSRDRYGRRGPPDRPTENVVIEQIRIERAAEAAPEPAAATEGG